MIMHGIHSLPPSCLDAVMMKLMLRHARAQAIEQQRGCCFSCCCFERWQLFREWQHQEECVGYEEGRGAEGESC